MTDLRAPQHPDDSGVQVYLRLLGYVRPYWKYMLAAMVAMTIVASAATAFAALMRPMVDGSFVERDPSTIRWVPLALLGLFIVRGTAAFLSQFVITWVGRNMIRRIRSEMFDRLLRMPTPFYDHNSSGLLLSKLTYDVEQISSAASMAVVTLVRDSLTIIGLLLYMFYLSPYLAAIFLAIGPVMAVVVMFVTKRFRRLSRRIQRSVGDVANVAEEGIEGHIVVKTFGGQAFETRRFEEANERNHRQFMKFAATKEASSPVVQFLAAAALSLVVYLATFESVVESITPGAFMSFIAAVLLLLPALKNLTNVNSILQRGIAACQSVFTLIDSEVEQDNGTLALTRAQGSIEFRNVGFAYESSKGKVLDDVNLDIRPGETVALVGRSGSGKSTLAGLLPRFYDVQQGEILLDGEPVQAYPLTDLRRQISLVGQQVVLFNDTIAANIAYGVQDQVSDEQIREAARAAHALEFIERLPEGLNTRVGENGVLLSGGQRQRLAIARALLKDAPILILDEATSALDSESERQIQAALDTLMKGRTTLVIAHRLSTIENADRIVVLDSGRVQEIGRHSELLARNGAYAALHKLQFGGDEAAAGASG